MVNILQILVYLQQVLTLQSLLVKIDDSIGFFTFSNITL